MPVLRVVVERARHLLQTGYHAHRLHRLAVDLQLQRQVRAQVFLPELRAGSLSTGIVSRFIAFLVRVEHLERMRPPIDRYAGIAQQHILAALDSASELYRYALDALIGRCLHRQVRERISGGAIGIVGGLHGSASVDRERSCRFVGEGPVVFARRSRSRHDAHREHQRHDHRGDDAPQRLSCRFHQHILYW